MRGRTWIIAAAVAASSAEAQFAGECRGETIGELNECLAAAAPPAESEMEPTIIRPEPPNRASLGAALQPRDLRSAPPVANRRSTSSGTRLAVSGTPAPTIPPAGLPADPMSSLNQLNRDLRPLTGFAPGYDTLAPRILPTE